MKFITLKHKWSASWCHFDLYQLAIIAVKKLSPIECWMIALNLLMLVLAVIGFLLNHFFIHFYAPFNYVAFMPGSLILVILLWLWGSANRVDYPKSAYLILSVLYTIFASFCLGVLALAVMLTPSPWVLSIQLLMVDQWLGFKQLAVMHWMAHHMTLVSILDWCYHSWEWEVLCMVPVLTLCRQFPLACRFLLYSTMLSLLFCLIYMIWPSLSPAAVLPQHIFNESCYDCIHRFELLRHHQHYAFGTCGLIDFPSYHAALAMLAIWAFWRVPLLNILVTVFNSAIILATFLLGYHYLIDVIVAAIIVILLLVLMRHRFT